MKATLKNRESQYFCLKTVAVFLAIFVSVFLNQSLVGAEIELNEVESKQEIVIRQFSLKIADSDKEIPSVISSIKYVELDEKNSVYSFLHQFKPLKLYKLFCQFAYKERSF